jgi:hypothetical protein
MAVFGRAIGLFPRSWGAWRGGRWGSGPIKLPVSNQYQPGW